MADVIFVLLMIVVFAVLSLVARGGVVVGGDNIVGLVVSVLLVVYLVVALVRPERF
ncbi:MAG: K(+)-transporting ATPase subunit F [Pseudonocardiaceae bacterium]